MAEPETKPNSEPDATDATNGLRTQVEKVQRERDEYFELLKRAQADFENAHQRHRREREQERRYSGGALAKDLFGALDNLERALEAAKESDETSPLAQGVSLVHSQILDALKRHGITPIDAIHKPFDPNYHQAVTIQPSADHPPNTVIHVLQQGYQLHERVLRPASVILAAPPSN